MATNCICSAVLLCGSLYQHVWQYLLSNVTHGNQQPDSEGQVAQCLNKASQHTDIILKEDLLTSPYSVTFTAHCSHLKHLSTLPLDWGTSFHCSKAPFAFAADQIRSDMEHEGPAHKYICMHAGQWADNSATCCPTSGNRSKHRSQALHPCSKLD